MEQRICSRCNTVMELVNIQQTDVDRCGSCGSIWLDMGELGKLVKAPLAEISNMVAQGGTTQAPPLHAEVRLDCPACPGALVTMEFAGHRIDRCDQCRGILFEKDHLETGLLYLREEWQKRQG